MQKHTSGPWAVERVDYALKSQYRVIEPQSLLIIADVAKTDDGDDELPNARLIAAAPEMRELLARTQPGGLSPAAFEAWSTDVRALLARIDGVEP